MDDSDTLTSAAWQALSLRQQQWLDNNLPSYLGNVALQIGQNINCLASSSIHDRIYIVPKTAAAFDRRCVVAECSELPIAPASIDLAVLIHPKELFDCPLALLSEVHQALAPHGKLIVFTLNAISLWCLQQKLSARARKLGALRYQSSTRVNRSLQQAHFTVLKTEALFYRPLLATNAALSQWQWLEAVGSMLYPNWGAVTVTVAQKREVGMTPLRFTDWFKSFIVKEQCAEPTTRQMPQRRDQHDAKS